MLIRNPASLHTHTIYSDGQQTAEEMIQEAIRSGFRQIGFSDHSFSSFDTGYCMPYDKYAAYQTELQTLKEKYGSCIQILTGIEQDYYADYPAQGFDYIIGSVHYIKIENEYISVDLGGQRGSSSLKSAADLYYNGDIYSLLELYFKTISCVAEGTCADIIGHFDVIRKSNEQFPFFDPEHPRYISAWKKAADCLLLHDKLFEINVSPVLNGFLSAPYPAPDIQRYIQSKGGRFIYTGDCHSVTALRNFSKYLQKADYNLK